MSVAGHEAAEIARANETDHTRVVFVHGLWPLPSSWDRWAAFFEEDAFVALTPRGGMTRRPGASGDDAETDRWPPRATGTVIASTISSPWTAPNAT